MLSVPRCHSPCDIWDGIQPPIGSDCLQLLRWLWKRMTSRSCLNLIICCLEERSCCQLKNVASVKVGLKEMENAARLDSILSLCHVRNSCYLHWHNFNQSMSYFQSSATIRYTLSPFTCVCMFRTLCLWGFILIEGSSGAAAWNGFTLTAFSFRSLHSKKGRHCCVCVGTTCSLSFHFGRLSGVHPAEIDAATHRHMYYVDSYYTWKLFSLVA